MSDEERRKVWPLGTRLRTAGPTIQLKLSAVIVSLVVGLVVPITFALTRSRVRDLEQTLADKGRTYGLLLSHEVSSAVAFSDRQTAREVFASAAVDKAIRGLALYGADGGLLEAWGETEVEPGKRSPPDVLTLTRRPSAIRVVAPVISLEGPRGTLVLELGTAALAAGRSRAVALAVGWGFAGALCGLLAAWFIARSFAGRLAALSRAAVAVAGGDLAQPPIVDRSRDEIGRLTGAFNAMWAKLKELLEQNQRSAREEADRLEGLVKERTSELNRRNDEMRLVLDNVEQGLVTVDRQGRLSEERSRILDEWFGAPVPGQPFWDWICRGDENRGSWLAAGWEAVTDDLLPLTVALDQLPKRVERGPFGLEISYKPVQSGTEVNRFLIVITDVTAREMRERAEVAQRELANVVERFHRDREFVRQFFQDARRLVAEVSDGDGTAEMGRALHTLKGNAAVVGLGTLAKLCDQLESSMATRAGCLDAEGRTRLLVRWEEEESRFRSLVGEGPTGRVEIEAGELEALEAAVERGASPDELRGLLESCRAEPLERRLAQLGEQADRLAERLGKTPLRVSVDAGDLRLRAGALCEFWGACVHVIRNAIDHGLETADERRAAGKPEEAELVIAARVVGEMLEVEIRDSGRGIDWEKVRASARRNGVRGDTAAELQEALFVNQVTSRRFVTEISGRGYGMGAVRQACERTGGTVGVSSEPGVGTSIRFRWPAATVVGVVAGHGRRTRADDAAVA